MSNQPNWHDVRFNHRAAQEAVAQCRSAADALRRANQQRNELAASAREDWRGRLRNGFDDDLPALTSGAAALAGLLDTLARAIEAAAQAAVQEQRAREDQRQRWREQQAAQSRGG